MGNQNSNESPGFVKSSSYSTLNLNKKLNVYANSSKINTQTLDSGTAAKLRRRKSASTSSLSMVNCKNNGNEGDKIGKASFFGKCDTRLLTFHSRDRVEILRTEWEF